MAWAWDSPKLSCSEELYVVWRISLVEHFEGGLHDGESLTERFTERFLFPAALTFAYIFVGIDSGHTPGNKSIALRKGGVEKGITFNDDNSTNISNLRDKIFLTACFLTGSTEYTNKATVLNFFARKPAI